MTFRLRNSKGGIQKKTKNSKWDELRHTRARVNFQKQYIKRVYGVDVTSKAQVSKCTKQGFEDDYQVYQNLLLQYKEQRAGKI